MEKTTLPFLKHLNLDWWAQRTISSCLLFHVAIVILRQISCSLWSIQFGEAGEWVQSILLLQNDKIGGHTAKRETGRVLIHTHQK